MRTNGKPIEFPIVPDNEATDIQNATQQQTIKVLYYRRIGIRPYKILGASPDVMEEWKKQIKALKEALKSKDKELIASRILRGYQAGQPLTHPKV